MYLITEQIGIISIPNINNVVWLLMNVALHKSLLIDRTKKCKKNHFYPLK